MVLSCGINYVRGTRNLLKRVPVVVDAGEAGIAGSPVYKKGLAYGPRFFSLFFCLVYRY